MCDPDPFYLLVACFLRGHGGEAPGERGKEDYGILIEYRWVSIAVAYAMR